MGKIKLVFGCINMWKNNKEVCTPSIWFWAEDDYFSVAVILFIFMFVVRFADRELEEKAEKVWRDYINGNN